jgi:ABC-2 type transport system ATP-binding protein
MTQPVIEVKNLSKIFRRPLPRLRKLLRRGDQNDVVAVKDVSFTIGEGEIFGLVGRNGAGKSTLVKCIATLVEPTQGTVTVSGFDTVRHAEQIKKRIGLVSSDERSFYWRLTGYQNLLFFARLQGMREAHARQRIDELLDLFELRDLSRRRFREYSTGNKQRLAMARALLTDPPVLLLDEPTRSLDPIAADELRRLIRQWAAAAKGKTVLITTHNLAEVEQLCRRVAILSQGELRECATLEAMRAKYLGQEQVCLRLRALPSTNGFPELQSKIPTLRWQRLDNDSVQLQFSRETEDGSLNLVFDHLLKSGAEILDCQTSRPGLKEVMETIEQQGA